jgi:hypothetical protein
VTNDDFARTMPKNRKRLLERLDHMIDTGQVTAEEATEIRAATNAEDHAAAVVKIRTRHARARLDAAVEAGQMTEVEANASMEQIERGQHPRSLRSHLRKITSEGH